MAKHPPLNEQAQKFIDAAREAECDEDEARWEEKLRQVAKHKPKDEKPAE